jgi:hypothetical protein
MPPAPAAKKAAKVLSLVPKAAAKSPPKSAAPQAPSNALSQAINDAIKPETHTPGTPLPRRKSGPPPTYSKPVADEILERIANGELLNRICEEDGMPPASTFRRWVLDDVDGLAALYARARELGWHWHGEEIVELSNRCRVGAKIKTSADGVEVQTADMVDRTRLQIDARKWVLSKMLPKVYGEKLEVGGNLQLTLAQRLKAMSETDHGQHAAMPESPT